MIYLKEGVTPLNFAYNDEIIQEGNSKYQLSFKFPTNNPLWEELVEETLLLADDLHGEQEFIVFEVEKHHGYITVYANQVATLLNNYSITELSVNNASGDRVMRSLVSSIIREHKFTFSSDIANTHSLNLKNVTVATALFKDKHSILGQWGGDLIRDKYDIRLLSNGGATKEALFMYKKNLKSYQQKKSIKDLRTRIHFTKTINSQKEGEKDKVIAVTVDSPLIGKYKNIYEGNLDVSDQDVTDEATLRKYGEQYFKTTLCDVIEENIEISVLGTPDEPVQIFDTVTIFYEKYNLDVKKKITKYTYAPMGRKLKTIGFGKIQSNLGTTLATMVDNAIEEKAETMLDAFKIQKNLAQLLKLDRKGIEDKLVELEEKSKGALEVKKALFEADGTIPDVVKAKILDAVEGDIGRLKTIITEAELIKAIQAKLNYADIKNALIDKAFINQIISDEKFTQQFEDGQVTTQNIFTKLKDSIKSNISKEFVTKDGVRKLVNDLTIDADGIRQITQQESSKVFETKKSQLQGINSYIHKKYSDYPDGRNMSDNSTLKYIGIYTGDKQQAPTNASEYSWTKIKSDGKLYKAYSNSLNGIDFTLVEPDENAKLFAKNRPRVNIVNDNDISDIWQANMFLSFKPNTKYTLTARAKGNSNKLWAYFRNNKTSEEYSWGQLEFRGLETKSITFTTTNDVDDVLFKFVLVPEDEDWTGIQIDWFTIYEGDKRYTDYPVDEPAQYHKYRYFGYVFKEGTPVASDFEWFDLQQTSITNDKYTHIVYSDNADGSNFGREPKKYMGVARTTSPTQPTDKTAYKWFKVKGEDGVSNYIHRKYSDFSNGANMSDNSNLKYIGIYTGTSQTPPTTASSYLWSKIKGEDGANGVPGAKGADGRTPYFHTAYSNSPTGDRDFSTTNSTGKEYIGTYSDFEVADSTDYRKYKWVKIKGEDGQDGKSINENLLPNSNFAFDFKNWEDKLTNSGLNFDKGHAITHFGRGLHIYGTANAEFKGFSSVPFNLIAKQGEKLTLSMDLGKEYLNNFSTIKLALHYIDDKDTVIEQEWQTIDLATQNFEVKKYKRISSVFTVKKDIRKCRVMIYVKVGEVNNFYIDNIKLERGEVATEWTPAYVDLQAHSLTANLRFEGTYINNITNNVKAYLDVFYDGKRISSGFNTQVKYKGGNRTDWSNFWNANVDNTGRITNLDWGNREQNGKPLEVIVLVTYKDSNTVANARMENIPDVVEIKEITKKYKTFESTIDQFNSTIGEVKQQVLANEEKRNLVLGSRMISDKDYKGFGNDITRIVYQQYKGLPYMSLISYVHDRNIWQGVGFNLSKYSISKGERYSIRIPIRINSIGVQLNQGANVEIKNHSTGEILWNGRLDISNVKKDEWVNREFTFTASKDMFLSEGSFWIYIVRGGIINIAQPYMCEGDALPKNYSPAPEDVYLQNSRIESSINQTKSDIELKVSEVSSNNSRLESIIKQTKDKIDLKVSKDEIISAINLSVERDENGQYGGLVKIDADKVDIKGVLRAYTGEIGGFRIGHNYNDNGFWLTGKDNFNCGINPGHNAGTRGAQIWAAWGDYWHQAGENAWWVDGKGVMVCKNTPTFHKGMEVYGRYIDMHGNDIKGDNPAGGKTNVMWWSQINRVKSAISDQRLKTNIKPTKINALDTLNNIEMVEFNWKKDNRFEKIGAIAQQVQSVEENLVVHDMDDKQTYNDYLRINYYDTIPYLIKAIQELSTENQQLKSQLKEMNERLIKLEDKINGNL